jgi:hypothetical protein
MKLKFALSLIALLAAATADSHAAFQVTFRAGNASRTIVDGGAFDTNADPGIIQAANFTLTDSTDANFSYTFQSITVDWSVIPGVDGDGYAINAAAQMNGLNASSKNKTVSMFASVTDLTSIIGEPAIATANSTISLRTPYPTSTTTTKVGDVTYGAYYDTTNTLSTSPTGTSILSGTDGLFPRSNPQPDASAAFSNTVDAPDFTTSSFGMGVFYSVAVTNNTFTAAPRFSFGGSSQLEQAPEPAHTALPVGLAAGLLVLRRRRVIR